MVQKTTSWFLILSQTLLLLLKIEAKVPGIIVFGDSTVDTGNNNQVSTILKSNFKPYGRDFPGGLPTGRFSNGKVCIDFISEAFKCKPTVPAYLDPQYGIKDFATGVCFASAGTGYDNATSDVLSVIPLWKELEYYNEYQKRLKNYVGEAKASEIIREAMYIISLGTNDFLENYFVFPKRSVLYTVEEYEIFLLGIARSFIEDLYRLGARKIAIAGLPPMGCLPLVRTISPTSLDHCLEKYNNVAKDFNQKLEKMVVDVNKKLSGIRIVVLRAYDTALDIMENPVKYGFEKATVACCGSGLFEMSYLCNQLSPLTCKDASKYVFWDSFHPTEKMNFIIADHLMKTTLAEFL